MGAPAAGAGSLSASSGGGGAKRLFEARACSV